MRTGKDDRDLSWRQNGRDMVSAEIEQMLGRRGMADLAPAVPQSARLAAAWILDVLIDPPAADESIREMPAHTGTSYGTPYRDRAVYLANKYLHLSAEDQGAIAAYAKSGIRWRGDGVEFLALIAAEKLRGEADRRGREALSAASKIVRSA